MFTKAFAEYQKTHPNVKLDAQASDAQQYNQKIIAEAQTKTLPDVLWWNAKEFFGAASTGAFLDMSDIIGTQFKDRFVDGTFTMATASDGKIWCLPCEMQIQGFLVNTALFKQLNVAVPQTFDDLLQLLRHSKTTVSHCSETEQATSGLHGAGIIGLNFGASTRIRMRSIWIIP